MTVLLLLAFAGACEEPEARAFDFWVGEWDVVNRWHADSGEWVEAGTATNEVFHVLDGCAVVELWDGRLNGNHLRGFSVRAWDPRTRDWALVLNWPRPERPAFVELRGTFRHGRGEFFRTDTTPAGQSSLTRFTFSDITDRTLRWNDGTSLDGGRTWTTRWIMEFTRRDARTDPPLRNVPLADPGRTRLCPAHEARAFDAFLGTWADSAASVRLHSMAIAGECVILDQLAWADATGTRREALLVRAREAGGWVQYVLDSERRHFIRFEGRGPAELVGPEGREAMHWSADGAAGMTLRWDGAPGGTRSFTLRRTR